MEEIPNCKVATRPQMETEALYRLKTLQRKGQHENVAREYERDRTLYYTERVRLGKSPIGVLYWVSNEESLVEAVKAFEERYDACVYFCILTRFKEIGTCLDMLYVSKHAEEWESDRDLLEEGYAYSYCYSVDGGPAWSEIGLIQVESSGGGLIRVA